MKRIYIDWCIIPTDQYDGICKLMENYISTGTTQTPARGKGQRKSKKSSRLIDTDDEEPLESVS